MKYSEAKKLYRYSLKSPLYVLVLVGVIKLFDTIYIAADLPFRFRLFFLLLKQVAIVLCVYGLWRLIVAVVYLFMHNLKSNRKGSVGVKGKSIDINQPNKDSKTIANGKKNSKTDLWSTSEYNFERKLREQQKVHSEEAEIQSTDREDMSNNV